MFNLKFNKITNYKIALTVLFTCNIFAAENLKKEAKSETLQVNQSQILKEIQNIIKLERKNSLFRKFGYAAAAAGTSYYLFKDYFLPSQNNLKLLSEEEIRLKNQAIKEFSEYINSSKNRINNAGISKHIGRFANLFELSTQMTDEENLQLLAFLKAGSQIPQKQGYISGFFNYFWGLGTSIGFQLALGTTIAWTGKNFYKHFMPLSYEYFINHHTHFEQALEMVNACTILDPEKNQDELYVSLSKENLKLAYNHLLREGQKVIAFMLYIKIKNKDMASISRTTLDNLAENFKNNLEDISNFIESYNLLAIKNRIAAINNTSKMVANLEEVLAN